MDCFFLQTISRLCSASMVYYQQILLIEKFIFSALFRRNVVNVQPSLLYMKNCRHAMIESIPAHKPKRTVLRSCSTTWMHWTIVWPKDCSQSWNKPTNQLEICTNCFISYKNNNTINCHTAVGAVAAKPIWCFFCSTGTTKSTHLISEIKEYCKWNLWKLCNEIEM